jgi:Ca2+/Na+ antiporter
MFALARLLGMGLIVLTVVYICLSLYSRSVRREKLETEWEEQGRTGDRDAFVQQGLQDYDHSLRRKLILGVYVVPILVVSAIIYLTNFH